jgi:putative FmdB family regulatory protein
MPTYEYKCEQCGLEFERFQKITDEPLQSCPQCLGRVRRVLSPGGGIIIKKSGGFPAGDPRSNTSATKCGRETTCCGREERCEKPPCGE